jgi:hypothetical protein
MVTSNLRTTAFVLPRASIGKVHTYRAGEEFAAAWRRLEAAKGLQGMKTLPYASLNAALRAVTGRCIEIYPRLADTKRPYFLVASGSLAQNDLRRVMLAWEHVAIPGSGDGMIAAAAHDLREEIIDLGDLLVFRDQRCVSPLPWIWDVAHWELARRLTASPLMADVARTLRMDTDGTLLTWDDPVVVQGKFGLCSALHRIQPRLVTIPGLNMPAMHFDSRLVRLTNRVTARVRSGFADYGQGPILSMGVRSDKQSDGTWRATWDGGLAKILQLLKCEELPEPEDADITVNGKLRFFPKHQPARYPIGTGTGQMFHDVVATHVRQCVPEAEPVGLVKAIKSLEVRSDDLPDAAAFEDAVKVSGTKRLDVVAVFATAEMRKRMTDALADYFAGTTNKKLRFEATKQNVVCDGLVVRFVTAPDAVDILCCSNELSKTRAWLDRHLPPQADSGVVTACLIETTAAEDRTDDGQDPKPAIRRLLAERGMVTQFIAASSAPRGEEKEDHGARSAVRDLFRAAGVFPKVFPHVEDAIDPGTLLVGVQVLGRQDAAAWRMGQGQRFVVSMVAVEAGRRRALGFSVATDWAPLAESSTAFLAADQGFDWNGAKSLVEKALARLLVRFPSRSMIVFVESSGCSRFWSGLADTGTIGLPVDVGSGRVAVVRVRHDSATVPRPAGKGGWPEDFVFPKPGTMSALLKLEKPDYEGAWYYVNSSATMKAQGSHREHTRFTCEENARRDNWHAMTLTEFLVVHDGPFQRADLYKLSALLCRQAPSWKGVLSRPSPIHLATAVIKDHPGKYLGDMGEVADDDEAAIGATAA